jgi:hypothetical protein
VSDAGKLRSEVEAHIQQAIDRNAGRSLGIQ